jgi:hypothetical protein
MTPPHPQSVMDIRLPYSHIQAKTVHAKAVPVAIPSVPLVQTPASAKTATPKVVPAINRSVKPHKDYASLRLHLNERNSSHKANPINSQQQVVEWQKSYRGNPKPVPYAVEPFVSPVRVTSTTSELVKPDELSLFDDHDAKSSTTRDLATLISIDDAANVMANITTMEISFSETIVGEDSSILAEMSDAFVLRGHGHVDLEYNCLSDASTDLDSQDEEIEFKYDVAEGDDFLEGDEDVRVVNGIRGSEDVNAGSSWIESSGNCVETKQLDSMFSTSTPAENQAVTEEKEEKTAPSEFAETSLHEPSVSPKEPQSLDQLSNTEECATVSESSPETRTATLLSDIQPTMRTPSPPAFAKIAGGLYLNNEEQPKSSETPQTSPKEDLRNFILRSGLFPIA